MKGFIQLSAPFFFFVFLLAQFCEQVAGQSIRGKVLENDGKPLPFVNLLLMRAKDSTLVKGAVSDASGAYTLEPVGAGTYLLSANLMGYQRVYAPRITIEEGQTVVNLPVLSLAPQTQQLREVAITARRPFVEQQIDRTVVNVAGSIVASGSTALEVLEKAPGVTVDRQHDALQLRGKEGVIVQLDGRQTYLAPSDVVAMLRNMPSGNIDKIEIITNPSAKYEAAGNSGIINIVTRKNNTVGTSGLVSVAVGTGRYDRERGSMQINHRTRTLNLFGNVSANRNGNFFNLVNTREILDGERSNIALQDTYLRLLDRGGNVKAGIDYFLGKRTTVGLVWTGLWSNRQEIGTAGSAFRREAAAPVYLQALTDKTLSNVSSNQLLNLNLQHTFGKEGGQLTADFDLGTFRRAYANTLSTATTLSAETQPLLSGLFTQMPTHITIRTFKTDYNRSLADKWKMEAGLKRSWVRTDNNLTIRTGPASELQLDPSLSNHFQYTEQVSAAYLSFSGKWAGNTDLQLGLRAEHTHSLGNSLTLTRVVTRRYLDWFPSLFISRPLTKHHLLTFSYSRRIDRPNYQNLNPARSYVDPYLYTEGNPYLRPQYTHSLELKHGLKGSIFTSLGASFTNELVSVFVQPVDSVQSQRMPLNIGQSQVYNLTVSFPITLTKGWTLQTSLLGIYGQFQYTFLGIPQSVGQLSGRLNGTSSLALGKGWTAELAGWINTPAVNALYHLTWLGSLDLGVQKSLGSKWKAKLSVQDVFRTNRMGGKIDTPTFRRKTHLTVDTRVVMLNVSYAFGNQQLKGTRQRKTGLEDELQRTN